MKKLYESNLSFIKKLNVEIYKKIKKTASNNSHIVASQNGQANIVREYNQKKIYIHSNYDPAGQARCFADFALFEKPDIVFLFGLGMGYELKEMLAQNSDARYFIVEPDTSIFKTALKKVDITSLFNNNNIHFIQDDRHEAIFSFFNNVITKERSIKIKFIVLPAYQVLYRDLLEVLFKNLEKSINLFKVNFYTVLSHYRKWIQNNTANLKYLPGACPVTGLLDSFENVPAILVAAGPSLTYNLTHLAKVGQRAVIAAVGTGISIMEKNSIKAHLCGAIDGNIGEEKLVKNLEYNADSALLYGGNVYYSVPSLFKGSKFLLNTNRIDYFIYNSLKWPSFPMYSGSSVANVMLYNLAQLGCSPIILLGQDLCYSRNKAYAEDAKGVHGKIDLYKPDYEKFMQVKNKNGEMVRTTSAFLAMRDFMEECVKLFPNTVILNGTKDGLPIEGTTDIDFNDYVDNVILKSYNTLNIEESIKEVYKKHIEKSNYKNKINDLVDGMAGDTDKIKQICRDILISIENNVDNVEQFINQKEKELTQIPLYNEVVLEMISVVETLFKNPDYLKYCNQFYSYILEKCLIMENAFTYEVKASL